MTVQNNDGSNCFEIAAKKSNNQTEIGQEFKIITQEIITRAIALGQYEGIKTNDYTVEIAQNHETTNLTRHPTAQQLSQDHGRWKKQRVEL